MSTQTVNRFEWKYLVSVKDYHLLRRLFGAVLSPDPHAGQSGTYPVRSLYFDTPDHAAYHTRNAGLAARRKIRLRLYDPDQTWVKLECKEKRGNAQRKETCRISRDAARRLICGDTGVFFDSGGSVLPDRLRHAFLSEPLVPVVMVEYDREAYVLPAMDIRVNFDMRMRSTASSMEFFLKNPMYTPLSDRGDIVLEVKHGGMLPGFLRDILSSSDSVRTSYSKYCMAREAAF